MDNFDKKMLDVSNLIKNLQRYDNNYKLVDEIYKWINELSYFHNSIVKDGDDPSSIPYKIKSSLRPKEGQLAYFNLRRGYPKEIYDDHWCYVLKDFGIKYIVIPSTSIKVNSICHPDYEMDIETDLLENNSRLNFTDIRAIDTMRICNSIIPNVCDVLTDRKLILEKFNKIYIDAI